MGTVHKTGRAARAGHGERVDGVASGEAANLRPEPAHEDETLHHAQTARPSVYRQARCAVWRYQLIRA
eukprot:5018485-Prymnesium_polylepis.1